MQLTVRSETRGPAVPAFAGWAVGAVAGVVGVVHLVCGLRGGYWFDEAYMVAIGRSHLAWGSADQPPLVPALAGALAWLAPGSLVLLRIPAVLATAAAVLLAALIARELGGDRRAQLLTAGAQATALWANLVGHWLTPYTLEPVQWLTLVWLLVRWVRIRQDRLLLAIGVVAGVAAETKFQVLLLCAVLLAAAAVFGPRELLRRPLLWAGAGIGLLLAAPTLLWQAHNGWPQLRMGSVVASEAAALYGGRAGVTLSLITVGGVAGTALSLYGLWRLLRAPEQRPYRFVGVGAIALFIFFVVTVGRPYYLDGIYAPLCAAGALGFQQRRLAGGRWGWVVWPAYALSAAAAAGIVVISGSAADPGAAQTIAQRAAKSYYDLPEQDRRGTIVMGQSYIDAAYIDVYAGAGLPPAYSSNRAYGYFAAPPDSARSVLYVGSDIDELRGRFDQCRTMIGDDSSQKVWWCTGPHESWSQLWPRLRHLTMT
ncbi:glycosyltransferase family 39 protein [Nocardia vaccinii]|uniref:glycosyltransferase family 39 protein n=1 Tax=Nocardia vaccinii TaxID=1822 RepID=UPI000A702CAC|nr:glycosyltransferase family 39 protein [Nocardia vaccinii]